MDHIKVVLQKEEKRLNEWLNKLYQEKEHLEFEVQTNKNQIKAAQEMYEQVKKALEPALIIAPTGINPEGVKAIFDALVREGRLRGGK